MSETETLIRANESRRSFPGEVKGVRRSAFRSPNIITGPNGEISCRRLLKVVNQSFFAFGGR